MLKNITLIFLLAVAVISGQTEPVQAQGSYTVVDLEVEGNHIATNSLIMGVSSIDKGSPLTPASIQETIHRLYGLGIFSDVRIEAEEVLGGIKVTIVVKELPKLIGLDFSGNKEIKTKDLREKLALGVGGYISPYLIHEKKQDILKAYSEKGYFQAKVTHKLEYSPDSTEASLKYFITENSKVKVEKVFMTGNVRVEAHDLIKKMRNRKRGFLKSSDFAKEKYDEDLKKVIEEYHKKGFIDAYLINDSFVIDSVTNRMRIYLDVYEGPLYYFGKVTFKDNEKVEDKYLRKVLKFKEGEPFNSEKYDESVFELYTTYQEIGYLHTRIYDEKVTRADSIIDINYQFTEGLPSHINLVKIVGNYKTKDKVIRREISALPGQVFSRARLIRSVRDVMALNFFNNVNPVPVDLPSGDVDIEFQIEEKQTAQVSAGAGYNSTDKLVGSFGMGIPNFRGMGQNLSFNMEFGSSRNSYSISFTEPWLFGRPTTLGGNIYTLNRTWYSDYTEQSQGGSIRLGRRLRWPDNYFRLYTSYRLERNRYHDYDNDYVDQNSYKSTSYYDANDDGTYNTSDGDTLISQNIYDPYPGTIFAYNQEWHTASRLSFTIVRDSRNLPQFATSGSKISYTFSNTGGILGGYWHYQKHQLELTHFFPLFGGIALAAKVEFGAVTSPSGDDHISVSDRFVPGGTNYDGIVRGYDDGILTPDSVITQDTVIRVYNDTTLGTDMYDTSLVQYTTRVRGKFMLVSNFEIQIPIIKNQLYSLLFFDAGNSWLDWGDIRPISGLYKGAGFGFRIQVPGMGTMGFDFGYPLDYFRDEGKSWHVHFQIGTTF